MRNSTLPKKWEQQGWIDLGSDVGWEDYGGMWGKKAPHEPGAWYVLRFTNMEDAAGERGAKEMGIRYECSIFRVNPDELPEEKKRSVLKSFSAPESWTSEAWQAALIYGLVSDGCAAPLSEHSAWNYPTRVRAEAKREADEIMNDYNRRQILLDRPVNAIGTTAREFGQGDVLAGLRRYEKDGTAPVDPKKDLMLRMETAPIKRVKQRALSGECIAVQIWGTAQCAECMYKDTAKCGGPKIRQTGENEKGVKIGRNGL